MKTLTADQLRKHALATGSELEMGGSRFNSDRAQLLPTDMPVATAVASVALPPPPAAPTEPAMTRAEVAALMAERDAVWSRQIDHLTKVFAEALKAAQPTGKPARVAKFDITYDRDKCVTSIVPVYAH